MRIRYLLFLVLCFIVITSGKIQAQSSLKAQGSFTKYVNPFVGTTPLTDSAIVGFVTPEGWRPWSGLTYPGSSLPNAMVQLSPITEWRSGAGYEYEDSTIIAFAHTNKGHWNLCNIPVLPVSGTNTTDNKFSSRFSHDKESASPGYYQVYLEDYGINVQLTSTLRCGYHQYDFSDDRGRKVLLYLAKDNNRVRSWGIEQAGNSAVQGFQDVGNDKIYFYASFSSPIGKLEKLSENTREGRAIVHLKDDNKKKVELKIGLSFVSVENAKQNLKKEIGSKSFQQIHKEGDQTWETLLSKIAVEGGTEKRRELFYSSLYRAFLWPALRSDVNGEYTDEKGKKVKASFNYYTVPSLWDTYRNKLVLLAIVSPKVTADVIQSLKDMGDKTGFIPTFFHGDHGASFIAGSYLRGIDDFDVQGTYKLLLKNAFVEGRSRPHLNEYMEKGYISEPHIDSPHVETKAKAGVSKTLEYAYDYYALA
jgi:predicted alpha-1,2-mannosidase